MGSRTLRSPIFRKLLLAAFLLILTALAVLDFLMTGYTAARERTHAEEQMETAARILAPSLAGLEPSGLEDWAKQQDARARLRVTLIDRQGAVLADSQHDPRTMENHGGRPEVREAIAGRRGADVRRSATLDIDLCYLAIPVALKGQPGAVLRLAMPLAQVSASAGEIRGLILRATLIAAALSLLVAYFISRVFTQRIHRIQTYAQELVRADYSGTLPAEANDELGSVAASLRGMAGQFREMLSRLSEESSRREAILSSMVEGVLAVDRELRVTFCNDAFARAVDASLPVAEHLPLQQLVRDPALLDLLAQVLAQGHPSRRRLPLVAARGRVFEVQAAPLGEGARRGAIAILHDITELEHLERVRKDFVANVSHELRTPLAAIRGYAETLLDGALEDPQYNRKFLAIISAHTVRLGDMAADLLALCELEAERAPLPAERVPLGESAEAALRTVEGEARARKVELSGGDMAGICIRGQRYRLEHALINLLANAVKFNRPGGSVRLEAAQSGSFVAITVKDTGIGIPSDQLPRIFERFYCVDKARSRETGGTGLGLSIVKHIAEKMAGHVSVESQLGKGSTFTLTLPAA